VIQLYLNATPRQGTESLTHWAAFRLALLRSDDATSAREVAAAEGVKFRGGTGSCVIDAYAAPAASWARAYPLLFQAVAAYLVR
jgi:hypothetical protein